MIKQTYICDAVKTSKTTITDEGFLKTEAVVTKAGVYPYHMSDGKVVFMLKHPDDIFDKGFTDSLKLIPITNDHPPQNENGQRLVTAKTAKNLSIGYVGENIGAQDKSVTASLAIIDSDAVKSVKDGKRQLSVGFLADLISEQGIYDGQEYTLRQTNIRANHIALCNEGRVGAEASIMMDSKDTYTLILDNNNEGENMSKEERLAQVVIDSINYDAAPEVANALNKATTSLSDAAIKVSEQKALIDSLQGAKDALEKKVEELQSRDLADEIEAAAKKRVDLLQEAKNLVDSELFAKLGSMNSLDIKKEVLKSLDKDIMLDDKSEEYVSANFDAMARFSKTSKMAENREQTKENFSDSAKPNTQKNFMNYINNAWRKE